MSLFSRIARALSMLALVPAAALAQPAEAPQGAQMEYVRITTSMGDIVLELNREKAPLSVQNFLEYVDKGHYEGTIFHRVIPGFMIQGGGFTKDLEQKSTNPPIKNEWQNGLKNVRGAVSMARTAVADSATSQFFINVVNNAFLDQPRDGAAYAVFGRVVLGMPTVDKIRYVKTGIEKGMGDVPVDDVIIERVARIPAAEIPAVLEAGKSEAANDAAEQAKAAEAARVQAEEAAKQAAAKVEGDLAKGIELVKSKGGNVAEGSKSASGLWTLDAKMGDGESPAPTSTVKVHYTGWLVTGTEFDSSHKRGQPIEFPLNGVIKGWTEGVSGMKAGGKRYLVIPPALAYGERGAGGVIPPNSVLVFEVDLLEVKK